MLKFFCLRSLHLAANQIKQPLHIKPTSLRNFSLKHNNTLFKDALQINPLKPLSPSSPSTSSTSSSTSSTSTTAAASRAIGYWLLTCSGAVFVAVSLGGITRLTESGLSMVTWRLLGESLPLTQSAWLEEFSRYQQFPEYQITNRHISLEEFKRIWYMEYAHRMWGRLIGAVYVIPAVYFWRRGAFDSAMKKRAILLGGLIGCQGLMGWYMVKSGLESRFEGPEDVPRVSQYRLASHLAMAFLLYAGCLYTALEYLLPKEQVEAKVKEVLSAKEINKLKRFKRLAMTCKGLVFLTAISGAFVAGLDAGLIYNTFPKMAGKWIPDDILAKEPIERNFTENPTTVQFDHRLLGVTTLTAITYMALRSRRIKLTSRANKAVMSVLGMAYVQVALGIATLVEFVPTHLAAMHQSSSLVLLSAAVWLSCEMKRIVRFVR